MNSPPTLTHYQIKNMTHNIEGRVNELTTTNYWWEKGGEREREREREREIDRREREERERFLLVNACISEIQRDTCNRWWYQVLSTWHHPLEFPSDESSHWSALAMAYQRLAHSSQLNQLHKTFSEWKNYTLQCRMCYFKCRACRNGTYAWSQRWSQP